MSDLKTDLTVHSLMEGFNEYMLDKNISQSRARMIINFVRKFNNYTGKTYRDIDKNDIIVYLSDLMDNENLQESSAYRHLVAIKKFFEFLKNKGIISKNPCTGINIGLQKLSNSIK